MCNVVKKKIANFYYIMFSLLFFITVAILAQEDCMISQQQYHSTGPSILMSPDHLHPPQPSPPRYPPPPTCDPPSPPLLPKENPLLTITEDTLFLTKENHLLTIHENLTLLDKKPLPEENFMSFSDESLREIINNMMETWTELQGFGAQMVLLNSVNPIGFFDTSVVDLVKEVFPDHYVSVIIAATHEHLAEPSEMVSITMEFYYMLLFGPVMTDKIMMHLKCLLEVPV